MCKTLCVAIMGNNRKENGVMHPAPLYDAEMIIADVKNGCGFYEACRKEHSRRASPGRKSLALLAEGLKLLASPSELPVSEKSTSESMQRLRRIAGEFSTCLCGQDGPVCRNLVKKRIYGLLEDINGRGKERGGREKETGRMPDGNDVRAGQPPRAMPGMTCVPPPVQGGYDPYAGGGMADPQSGVGMMQGGMDGIPPGAMPPLPPIEVGERLSGRERGLLYDMLLANGCTPQEAENGIMNLEM